MQFLLDMDVNFRCWLTPEISWPEELQKCSYSMSRRPWPVVLPSVDPGLQGTTCSTELKCAQS
jgi:hypothetical protein